MHKLFDDEFLTIKDTASVLEVDTSQVYRLFRDNKIIHNLDKNGNLYTKKANLIEFLNGKLPSGFSVVEEQSDLQIT